MTQWMDDTEPEAPKAPPPKPLLYVLQGEYKDEVVWVKGFDTDEKGVAKYVKFTSAIEEALLYDDHGAAEVEVRLVREIDESMSFRIAEYGA